MSEREGERMQIERDRTALIVIDAIDAIEDGGSHEDRVYDPDITMGAYRRNVGIVVDLCHAAGIPVLFLNDQHIPGIDHELELWGEHGIKDRMAIFPEVEVWDSDLIIPKRRYSGFFQTDLDLTLREMGVDTLIAVGADTNICVLHTLADAYFNTYKTIVVEDATTTFLCGTQEAGIEHFVKCYGSSIVSVEELKSSLA